MLLKNFLFRSKSGKEIWQEQSNRLHKNVIVAKGIYKDGKRVGTWVFTSEIAGMIQSYRSHNYDENIALIDSSDQKNMECIIADSVKTSGSLINRVKTGSFLCNTPPSIFRLELPEAINKQFPNGWELHCSHTFMLDLTGAIINHEIRVKYENTENDYVWDKGMPDTEFKHSVPYTMISASTELKS